MRDPLKAVELLKPTLSKLPKAHCETRGYKTFLMLNKTEHEISAAR